MKQVESGRWQVTASRDKWQITNGEVTNDK